MKNLPIEMARVEVNDFGGSPFAEHNMPCAVCWKESAVLNINEGIFLPGWKCQAKGWTLIKKFRWFRRG